jgi:hypothetical protein
MHDLDALIAAKARLSRNGKHPSSGSSRSKARGLTLQIRTRSLDYRSPHLSPTALNAHAHYPVDQRPSSPRARVSLILLLIPHGPLARL